MNTSASNTVTLVDITQELAGLPPESLALLLDFARFLRARSSGADVAERDADRRAHIAAMLAALRIAQARQPLAPADHLSDVELNAIIARARNATAPRAAVATS